MKKAITKPVNYTRLREIAQIPDENPALFYSRLVEAMPKHTNLNPESTKSP